MNHHVRASAGACRVAELAPCMRLDDAIVFLLLQRSKRKVKALSTFHTPSSGSRACMDAVCN